MSSDEPKTVIENVTERRFKLIDRADPSADESMRVSMVEIRKSPIPHQWQRRAEKNRSNLTHWECTVCGGWVQVQTGVRPNAHLSPTCAEMAVKQVHDR